MQPSVTMVMLYADRPQFIRRAIASFRSQTYPDKRLLVFDNGVHPWDIATDVDSEKVVRDQSRKRTVGILRNDANALAKTDIIVHGDVDDWSHPRRIEEQVALLQASGKECVGYRDMLFWNETEGQFCGAWLYTGGPNYCIGTSLCYWRRVWEERPFEDLPKGPTGQGEDDAWLRGVDHLGALSIFDGEPKMIASIHGSNTSSMAALAIRRGASEMKRVPQWDSYCRTHMKLK